MEEKLLSLILSGHPVNTDTRKIKSGDLFFALKGPTFNGNAYSKQALDMGASLCVVDETSAVISDECILVRDVLQTLQDLAHSYRKTFDIPFIVVAGSNGKTSSKELIYRVLSKKHKTFATPGNYNNHIGVPLSILSIPKDTQIAVLEIGANHAQEHALLCKIIEPTHAVITNNGKDHLEGFGSIEGVIKANSEVYDYFIEQKKGLVFVNADDSILIDLSKKIDRIIYGESILANIQGHKTSKLGPLAFQWKSKEEPTFHLVQSKMMGNYNIHNLLLATAIGSFFEVEPSAICQALSEYAPANNRSQWIEVENQKIILDAYNANPSSVQSALASLFEQEYPQRLILLGDMAELGDHSSQEHNNILSLIQRHIKPQDQAILVGKNFAEHQAGFNFTFLSNREEAISSIQTLKQKPYLWLVKGSRSSKMEEVVYGVFPELKK